MPGARIANARTYAENDPAGLPGHNLLLIIARLSDALDTLPLHEVSTDIEELLRDFFEARWREGKLSDLWTDEDLQGLLAVLAPYLESGG